MPTTRQTRYRYFRNRAKARRERLYGRKAGAIVTDAGVGKHSTRRQRNWSDYGIQSRRVYPKDATYRCDINSAPAEWATRPGRGQWGVPEWTKPVNEDWAPTTNYRYAVLNYRVRRVISTPRARHLPFTPYKYAMAAVAWQEFYPFEFYPSGNRNPNWELIQAGGELP